MIYLDNSATTKQTQNSLEVFNHYASEAFFNPSSIYGIENSVSLETARQGIIKKLGGLNTSSLVFTSGATEANNIVLNSFKDEIIISSNEHDSVFVFCKNLINQGKNVKICQNMANGEIDYQAIENLITANTKLVSVIHVNNETGVVNDLVKIKQLILQKNPNTLLHADGVQAFLKYNVDVERLGVDFYTISSHKVGGPKGIGGLWVKNKNKLKPLFFGGGQENGFRSGTENLPAIMAFYEVVKTRVPNLAYIKQLKQTFVNELTADGIEVNFENSSPYILSLTLNGVNGETIVNQLKTFDVFVSRGSACSSKKAGNRLFEALGYSIEKIKGLLRVSFLETNTTEEVLQAGKKLNEVYANIKMRTKKHI